MSALPLSLATRRRVLVGVLALDIGFLLGFVPQYRRAASLESELTAERKWIRALEFQTKLAKVRDFGCALYLEVVNRNYGSGIDQATEFFNQVRSTVRHPASSDLRPALEAVVGQRDSG